MELRKDSYCGLFCGACPFFIENQNKQTLNKLYQKFSANNPDIQMEDLECSGCKSNNPSIYCKDCDIKNCARNMNVEFCYQCDHFPCSKLKKFRNDDSPHHSVILKNQETIKSIGIKNWLNNQEKRWSCDNCQTTFTWYTKVCPNCGNKLVTASDEEDLI